MECPGPGLRIRDWLAADHARRSPSSTCPPRRRERALQRSCLSATVSWASCTAASADVHSEAGSAASDSSSGSAGATVHLSDCAARAALAAVIARMAADWAALRPAVGRPAARVPAGAPGRASTAWSEPTAWTSAASAVCLPLPAGVVAEAADCLGLRVLVGGELGLRPGQGRLGLGHVGVERRGVEAREHLSLPDPLPGLDRDLRDGARRYRSRGPAARSRRPCRRGRECVRRRRGSRSPCCTTPPAAGLRHRPAAAAEDDGQQHHDDDQPLHESCVSPPWSSPPSERRMPGPPNIAAHCPSTGWLTAIDVGVDRTGRVGPAHALDTASDLDVRGAGLRRSASRWCRRSWSP